MMGGTLKESNSSGPRTTGHRSNPVHGMELLWQPDIVSLNLKKKFKFN